MSNVLLEDKPQCLNAIPLTADKCEDITDDVTEIVHTRLVSIEQSLVDDKGCERVAVNH